jgi:Flp pilus assembly protein TadD
MAERLGRYEILSRLGKGAMGVVFLADDPLLGRKVAIKTIDLSVDDPAQRDFLRERLLRDARAAAALNHPHIVQIHDVVEENERASIVMEYIAGEDLASYLARHPAPDPVFTAHVIRGMAAALDYTHSRNVVHRDIKPANVMLDGALEPKITDFGIARITVGATATQTGLVMGTVEYMAPEQIKGEKVDGRADQFALGVVAYRMLTGKPLFEGESLATLAYKIVNEPPPAARSHNAKLPPSLDPVMAKVLAKDPNARYATCTEFATALQAALADHGPVAVVAPSVAVANVATGAAARTATMPLPDSIPTVQTVPPPQRRSKAPVIAVAVCGIAGLIAGTAIWKPWANKPAAAPVTQSATTGVPSALAAPTAAPPVETPPLTPAKSNPAAPTHTASSAAQQTPKLTLTETKAEPPAESAADDAETMTPVKVAGASRSQQAFNHGVDLMQSKDYTGALVAFSQATGLSPKWGIAYQGLGNAHQALGQLDLALKDFTQAIEINPQMPSFYTSRGKCHVAMNRDDLALEDFNAAIRVNPKAPHALAQRGELYLRRRQFPKALADLDAAISQMPENPLIYRKRAALKREMGDQAGARQDAQTANQIDAGRRPKK